jgi:DNA-binding GntR family transcriptional regulator
MRGHHMSWIMDTIKSFKYPIYGCWDTRLDFGQGRPSNPLVTGVIRTMPTSAEELVSSLADQIGAKISSGDYPPGTRLRQETLAEEFSVSRTPIREALRQLEVRGMVQHLPNQGAMVRAPSARDIREAYQVRAELEGLAASLAIEWITDEQIERMRQAQKRFSDTVDKLTVAAVKSNVRAQIKNFPNWVESNDEFHGVIIDASGNRRLKQVIRDMHHGFTRNIMLSALTMDGRRMRENVAQHEAIIEAVGRHDAVEARKVMMHHIRRSGELVVWWLESQGGLTTG